MSKQTSSDFLAKSVSQQQTDEVEISTNNLPHFDFVVPAYSKNRRLSSITSTVLPETLMNTISANISFSSAEQNAPSPETENNRKKGRKVICPFVKRSFFCYQLEDENRYSLEQMISYRHGQHVEDKALSRRVR